MRDTTYYFEWDDMPSPMSAPIAIHGQRRIILQVNYGGGSFYETICYVSWSADECRQFCEQINQSVMMRRYAEILQRAARTREEWWPNYDREPPIPKWHHAEATPDGFHWNNGWFFKREDNGTVRVRKFAENGASEKIVTEFAVPASEWESIVAAVAKGGSDTSSYELAHKLHAGLS